MTFRALRATFAAAVFLAGATACPSSGDGGVGTVLVVANVEVTPGISNVIIGTSQQMTAVPKTSSGIAVTGRTVAWSTTDPGTASVSSTGLVTGVTVGGPVRIRATVDGVNGDALVTVKPVPVDRVTVLPTSAGVLVAGSRQFTATAFDAGGAELSGRSFLWESSEPLIAAVTTTGLVIGLSQGGPVTITATAEGKSGSGTASVSTRPATRLAFAQQPGPSTAGAPLNPPIRIALQDDLLTTVLGATNPVTIAIAGNPAGGILGGTTTVDGVNGTATFSNLTLDRVGTSYTFQVTSPGLVSATSIPFDVTAGAANRLVIATQPSPNAQSGVLLPVQPVVRLQDGVGNNVATAGLVVTAAITSGGGTLGGTLTATTNAQGIATFTNLVINGIVGSYTLGFSVPNVTGTTSGPITLAPGIRAALVITQPPSSGAQSGVPFAQQPVLQLRDASGNNVPEPAVTVTVGLASGTGAVGGSLTATTNPSGAATFNIAINGQNGVYTLRFSAPGVTPATSGPITLGAGAPTQLAIITQPSSTASNGVPLAQQPVIQLRDASGNPVPLSGIGIVAAVSAGSLAGVLTVNTDASGAATFTNLAIVGVAGSYTITFSAPGTASVTSSSISLSAGAPTLLTITTQPTANPQSGTAFPQQPVIQVRDAANNSVPQAGLVVTAVIASGAAGSSLGGGVTATTNASGVATFATLALSGAAGPYTLRFTSGALTPVVSGTLTLGAGTATTIAAASATSQSAQSGAAVAAPPSVLVTDGAGNPKAGVSVTFAVTAGGGTIVPAGPATVVTNASGIATATSWTLGPAAGTNNNTATATAAGLTGSPVTFAASGLIGAATTIAANSTVTQTAVAGTSVTPPSVRVTDVNNNPVAGFLVTFARTVGNGSVVPAGPATVSTNASGIATATSWTLGTTAGANTVTATATGLAGSPVTFNATGTAGPAAAIVANSVTSQSATAGTAVAAGNRPSVRVNDANGNPVAGTLVTFAVLSGGGTVVPAGPATVATNAGGIATATSWTLGTTAGTNNNTVTATAAGLTGSPVSFTASGTAGAATQITSNSAISQSAPAGGLVSTPPSVLVRDGNNNPVAGTAVTFAVTAGGGTVVPAGPATVSTNASGIATATSWTLGTTAGTNNNTVTATATGLSGSPVTFTASGTVGTATTIAANSVLTQGGTAGTAVALANRPSAKVTDSNGNPVAGVAVLFTITAGSGVLSPASPATVTTDIAGIATVTSWTLGTVAGPNTVTASAVGLTGSPLTYNATGAAGAATTIAANSVITQSATVGTAVSAQPSVIVKDVNNNPVAGFSVTFAVTGGAGSLGAPTTVATDASGIATATNWVLGPTAGTNNNTVTATASGLGGSPVTFSASGVAGSGNKIAILTQPSTTAQSRIPMAQSPVIQLTDNLNNPVTTSGVTVTVSLATGLAATLSPTTAVTDVNGRATFTNLTFGGVVGPRTIFFASAGYTSSPPSNSIQLLAGTAASIQTNSVINQSAIAGSAVSAPPSALVKDLDANVVSGVAVTFAVTAGGGTVVPAGPATVTTNASGIATATGWTLGPSAGTNNNTVTATAAGLTGSPLTFTASGTAGAATQVTANSVTTQSGTAGSTVGAAPSVLVRDVNNNPVAGYSVTFAVTAGGGSLGAPTTVATSATGVATATNWVLGPTAGTNNNTVTATATGLAGSPVAFTASGAAGAATQISANSATSQSATVGTAVGAPPSVLVRDANNNPVAGTAVTFAVTAGGGTVVPAGPTTVLTNGSGIATATSWTLGNSAGTNNNTVTATATGLAGSPVAFTASGTAGAATQISANSLTTQSATVGTAVGAPPSVLVRDVHNNPVSGTAVTFAVTAGGGTVVPAGPTTVLTNSSGVATATSWTLGTTAGTSNNTVTATATGLAGSPVTFTASGTAGAATQISANSVTSQSATAGTAVGAPPSVLVRDASNNPVAGTAVTFAVTAGGGTVVPAGPTTVLTNPSGIAIATSWTLGSSAGTNNNTVTATVSGLAGSPVTFTASGTVGAATQISANSATSQSATVGTAVGTPPSVLVRDVNNNPVSGTAVTFAVTAGGGTVVPAGPTTVLTNASGVATATSWTLGNSAGTNNNTVTGTATGLAGSPVTFTASGTAGAATQISANSATSQSATVGTAVGAAPSVLVRDGSNNPVAGVAVTFAVTGGGGVISPAGPTAVITNSSGIATATSWTLGAAAGTNNNTATATATGLSGSPVTFTASGTAGAATQISANSVTSQSATAGTAVGAPPSVLVRDASNNPVAGTAVTFAVTAGGGTVVPAGPTTVLTNASGIATATSWTLGISAGTNNNTVTATATGLAGSPVAFTASGTAGAATQITANSVTTQAATIGTAVGAPPSVVVRDANGNPVAGTAVTFAVTAGGGSVVPAGPATVTTNASGLATATSWTLGSSAGSNNNTVTATATGLAGSPVTFTASGTAGSATQIAANSATSQSATVATTVGAPPSVLVRDGSNNPVAGVAVTFAVTGGGGTVVPAGPSTATTNASGIAIATSWTLGNTAGTNNNTVTATASGLTGSPVLFTASATAGSPTSIAAVSATSQSAAVSTAVGAPPSVRVTDSHGNSVSGVAVTFAVTAGGGTVVPAGPSTVTTNASGIATATSWTLGSSAGSNNNTVTATATGLAGSPVTFTASGTAGSATQIAANSATSQSATVATTVGAPPSVLVRDGSNNPVAGVAVTFAVTGGGGTVVPTGPSTVSTNASGIATATSWTLGNTAGTNNNTVTATATGLAGSPVTFTASGVAGSATTIAAVSTTSQSAAVSTAVSAPPSVRVTDTHGNDVSGVAVTFAVTAGGGTVVPADPATVTTNASGIATATSWTLGSSAGSNNNTVTATATGLTGSPVTFTASGTAGSATQIAANSATNQSAPVATAVGAPPSVLVQDGSNNPVAGVAVTFTVTGGGGTVVPAGPTTVLTNASGIATATSWTLGSSAGSNNNTVTATATGLTGSPVTFTASGTAGSATQIAANSATNQSAPVATAVGAPPSVLVQDGSNNPVAGVAVTFAVTGGGGTVVPAGPTTVLTNASGIATATSWTLGSSAGSNNNTVTATATGLTGSPVTFTASGTAGSATQIAANSATNQSAPVATAVGAPPSVLVQDGSNNPVAGVAVTFAVTGGGGTVVPAGPTTVLTNASGIATATSWTLGSSAGSNNNTVTATATGLTGSPVTFTASGTAGSATQIAANSATNQSAPVATAVGAPPSVLVQDGSNNPVAGVAVTFAVTGGGGTVVPAGPTTVLTNASGIATATSWTLGTTAGTNNNTVTATATGLSGSPVLFTASGTAGAANTIASNSAPSQSATVGTTVGAPPSVKVTDANGNPKAGVSVTFTLTGGGGTLTPASPAVIATDAAGVATLTTWTLGTTAGTNNNTVSATAAVPSGSPIAFSASGIAGAAHHLSITTEPSAAAANDAVFAVQPVIQLRDASDNAVAQANVAVTAELQSGTGTLGTTITVNTDVNGTATFTDLKLTPAGSYVLKFTAVPASLIQVISTITIVIS